MSDPTDGTTCGGALCNRGDPRPATVDEHPCPYQAEINDDPSPWCRCCETCEQECADDI